MIVVQQFSFLYDLGQDMSLSEMISEEPKYVSVDYYYSEDDEQSVEPYKGKINDFIAWLNSEKPDVIEACKTRMNYENDNGEYVETVASKKIVFEKLYTILRNEDLAEFLTETI